MSQFWPAVLVLAVAVVCVLVCYGVAGLAAVARPVIDVDPFAGGLPAVEHAVSRFHARWYVVSMVFLAFDMEMIFMYPWTLVVSQIGASSVIEMFLFLALLLAAVVYAWREGALRWA